MAEGRRRDEWGRTSSLMALIANTNRDPKKHRPFRAEDYDPFAHAAACPTVGVRVLKSVFLDRQEPRP